MPEQPENEKTDTKPKPKPAVPEPKKVTSSDDVRYVG